MSTSLAELRVDKRLMSYTAAAMYAGAGLDGVIQALLPGDPGFELSPALVALAVGVLLYFAGSRIPARLLAALGPLGVGMIAVAIATSPAGDGSVLYLWPTLWTTFFFGRRGAIAIIALVGVAHGLTLLSLPAASSYPGRWVDVMFSVSVAAAVVLTLVHRNDQLLARLAGEARTDVLTGLLNRRGFDERVSLELAHARRDGGSLAVAMFDIDHFKRVNDQWGHEIGDRVLAQFGRLLADRSRDIDVVARFGGEEFVVLLPGSDSSDALAFSERVRLALTEAVPSGLPAVRVSAGVHSTAQPRIAELLQGADTALYHAKHSGRDQTVVYERSEATAAAAFR